MKNQLQKLPPAWHAEIIRAIKDNFAKDHAVFLNSTKRAVWWGILFNEIKRRGKEDKSIPHGAFGPWLKSNVPEIHWDTCCTYMHLGRNVMEKGKFQISDFPKFAHSGELPDAALKLIEGKTQQQLFLEFKQVDGAGNKKRGRLHGGNSTASDALDIDADSFADYLTDTNLYADEDDLTMPAIESGKLTTLVNSLKVLTHRLEKILEARKAKISKLVNPK